MSAADTGSTAVSASEQLLVRWDASLMHNYGRPPVTLVRGEGARVWDADGTELLDLVAGIATNVLGHGHPAVVAAVSRQVAQLGHVSNLVAHPVAVELAERLLALTGRCGRAFFCNSGAEANETAFKIARLTGRPRVVAADGAFHGRTMGALSLTGQPDKRKPFEPLVPGVVHVPYGDVDALRLAVDSSVAAVFLEPLLGEGGVVVPPPGYLAAARAVCTDAGAFLILDEVQTGMGRTGWWFASQADGVSPDVMTLAKGLGGGLPLGACLAFGAAAELLQPGQHGTTFGGNPVCCAASLAVLDTIEAEGLLASVREVGALLRSGLTDLGAPVDRVRGAGLMLGVVLTAPVARELETALRRHGVLVNACAPDVVRLVPPLVLTADQASTAVGAFAAAIEEQGR